MNNFIRAIIVVSIIVQFGCAIRVSTDVSVKYDEKERAKVVAITDYKRSFFDPDGFSRIYSPSITLIIYGHGETIGGITTYSAEKDFTVGSASNCGSGNLQIDGINRRIKVNVSGDRYPCNYFNRTFTLSSEDIDILSK